MSVSPRMRMFAGPNGSGKSVLKSLLQPELLGVYLNADEVEASIRRTGALDLAIFGVQAGQEIVDYFAESTFLASKGLGSLAARLRLSDERVDFSGITVNAYFASVAVDFLRQQLLAQKRTFTFETVMSHSSKVDLLSLAQQSGYRTYLYYIATDDPDINVSRVENRVRLGGHDVPKDLIRDRYFRSLNSLSDAIRRTNRAYIFDNSTDHSERTWLAEISDGKTLEIKTDRIPAWFNRYVLHKIT